MYNAEERDRELRGSMSMINAIAGFVPEQLCRVDQQGRQVFGKWLPMISEVIAFYKSVSTHDYSLLPMTRVKELSDLVGRSLSSLQTLNNYDGTIQSNDPNATMSIIDEIENAHLAAVSFFSRMAVFFIATKTDLGSRLKIAEDKIDSVQSTFGKKFDEHERESKSIRLIAEEVRGHALTSAASMQSKHFSESANAYDKESLAWFWGIVCFSILLISFTVISLFFSKWNWFSPQTMYESIQLTVSKILVFTTIASAMYISVRNYAANRHNSVVNRHRQDALSTFHALVEAGSEPAKRDIVLAKAADCIFSPQPTGFSKTEGSDNDTINVISVPPNAAKLLSGSNPG